MISPFDELATAIRETVSWDRLVLHVHGSANSVGGVRDPVVTAIVPLFAGKKLIGRLHVTREENPFTAEERARLAYLAPYIAVSAASMRALGLRRRELAEAQALLEVGRVTATLLDPREVVQQALPIVARLLPLPTQFAVFAVDDTTAAPPPRGKLALLGSRSLDAAKDVALGALDLTWEDLGAERWQTVIAGQTFFSADAASETGKVGEMGKAFGVRSMLAIPLRVASSTLGVLCACRSVINHPFDDMQQRFLEGIADQIAVSVHTARLVRENIASVDSLRALSRRLWSLQEEERERIARELHDEAGQALTALKLNLDLTRRESDPERVRARIGDSIELAGDVLDELRRISRELRPGALHELGLVPSVRALATGFSQRTGIDVEFQNSGSEVPAGDSEAASTIYRFVQEALNHVGRDADAKHVRVELHGDAERTRAVIEHDAPTTGEERDFFAGRVGLLGMRERAKTLGGTLTAESTPERGTRLVLDVPAANG